MSSFRKIFVKIASIVYLKQNTGKLDSDKFYFVK